MAFIAKHTHKNIHTLNTFHLTLPFDLWTINFPSLGFFPPTIKKRNLSMNKIKQKVSSILHPTHSNSKTGFSKLFFIVSKSHSPTASSFYFPIFLNIFSKPAENVIKSNIIFLLIFELLKKKKS